MTLAEFSSPLGLYPCPLFLEEDRMEVLCRQTQEGPGVRLPLRGSLCSDLLTGADLSPWMPVYLLWSPHPTPAVFPCACEDSEG
jgi:hypothetical protein